MNDANILDVPERYLSIQSKTKEIGFSMPSDLFVGSLLKSLTASKSPGNFLELGTGTGLSLAWMVAGMDQASNILSIDNDPALTAIATEFFEEDSRVNILCEDGSVWINSYEGDSFDLIFADAWPGKYSDLDEVLMLLKPGGFYIIDDMLAQPNWPEGHQEKAIRLIETLESREDLWLTKMNWSTGIIIAVKR